MAEGENDYPLAKAVEERGGFTYHVKDHRDCFLGWWSYNRIEM